MAHVVPAAAAAVIDGLGNGDEPHNDDGASVEEAGVAAVDLAFSGMDGLQVEVFSGTLMSPAIPAQCMVEAGLVLAMEVSAPSCSINSDVADGGVDKRSFGLFMNKLPPLPNIRGQVEEVARKFGDVVEVQILGGKSQPWAHVAFSDEACARNCATALHGVHRFADGYAPVAIHVLGDEMAESSDDDGY